jgi:hypothetical protein
MSGTSPPFNPIILAIKSLASVLLLIPLYPNCKNYPINYKKHFINARKIIF